jgi:hypothetical protein
MKNINHRRSAPMTDRIRYATGPTNLSDLIASTAHHSESPETGGNTMAILTTSYRVVLKNGRLSGGRACALSARAASCGIQTCALKR